MQMSSVLLAYRNQNNLSVSHAAYILQWHDRGKQMATP